MKKLINLLFAGCLLLGVASQAHADTVCQSVTGAGDPGAINVRLDATIVPYAEICAEGEEYTASGLDTLTAAITANAVTGYISGLTAGPGANFIDGGDAGIFVPYSIRVTTANQAAATSWTVTATAAPFATANRSYDVADAALSSLVTFAGANQLSAATGLTVTTGTGNGVTCGNNFAGCTGSFDSNMDRALGVRLNNLDSGVVTAGVTINLDII